MNVECATLIYVVGLKCQSEVDAGMGLMALQGGLPSLQYRVIEACNNVIANSGSGYRNTISLKYSKCNNYNTIAVAFKLDAVILLTQ